VRRYADELQLTDNERALLQERLNHIDDQDVERAPGDLRSNELGGIAELVRTTYEATTVEFTELEYLA
jgi:hypothetical protein